MKYNDLFKYTLHSSARGSEIQLQLHAYMQKYMAKDVTLQVI